MKRRSRLDYAYAVGRVRALENHLVDRPSFMEATEEKDLSSALKIIFDAGQFHQEKIEIGDSENLDGFLNREKSALLELVFGMLQEADMETILLTAYGDDKLKEATEALNSSYFDKEDMGSFWGFVRGALRKLEKTMAAAGMATGGDLDDALEIEGKKDEKS